MWAFGGTVDTRSSECFSRRVADGHVIRVPVGTLWPKRDDDIRAEVACHAKDMLGKHRSFDLGESAVRVVETQGVLNTEDRTGLLELALAHLAQGSPGGGAGVADLSSFPAGRRHDHRFPPIRDMLGQRPPGAEDL